MADVQEPINLALMERSKEELVRIIERLKADLNWYVEERNRLIAELGNDGI